MGLDEVIVHDPHYTVVHVGIVGVFGERKVKARLEPVLVGPSGIRRRIGSVSEPRWIGFGDKELGVGDDFDERRHCRRARVCC